MIDKELLNDWAEYGPPCLSDNELDQLIEYYQSLQEALKPCPERYRLVLFDVHKQLETLYRVKEARTMQ